MACSQLTQSFYVCVYATIMQSFISQLLIVSIKTPSGCGSTTTVIHFQHELIWLQIYISKILGGVLAVMVGGPCAHMYQSLYS